MPPSALPAGVRLRQLDGAWSEALTGFIAEHTTWSTISSDVRRNLAAGFGVGAFHGDGEGQLIATATLSIWGQQGVVGSVVVHPSWRRKGVATACLNHILATAKPLSVTSFRLIASPQGAHLYRGLNFHPTRTLISLTLTSTPSPSPSPGSSPAPRRDRPAAPPAAALLTTLPPGTPASFTRHLHAILTHPGTTLLATGPGAWAALRPVARGAHFLGPVVAPDATTARAVVRLAEGLGCAHIEALAVGPGRPFDPAAGWVPGAAVNEMVRGPDNGPDDGPWWKHPVWHAVAGWDTG